MKASETSPDPTKQPRPHCIGLLLTGGSSTRFGTDKLSQRLGELSVAALTAEALLNACPESFEAGPGLTHLSNIRGTIGRGPLSAIAATFKYLRQHTRVEFNQGVIVLAGDMPLIRPSTLLTLANWPGSSSVVPVIRGKEQYLAARWSRKSIEKAAYLVDHGELRVKAALDVPDTQWLSLDKWESEEISEFTDVDTPEDFDRVTQVERMITARRTQRWQR